MHKQSSARTAETLAAAAAGRFHGNAAADDSRDCGIAALYQLPEIKPNEAEILQPHHHQQLAQTHFCFLKRCVALDLKVQGSKILDALQFYIYNYILRFVVKVVFIE